MINITLLIVKSAMFCIVLIVTAIYDFKTKTIPLLFPLLLLGVSLIQIDFIQSICGALIIGGVFGLAAVISKGKIGGGDFKLMTACGFFFGVAGGITQSIVGLLVGCIYGIITARITKQKLNETTIPLAPGLCAGGIFVCIANLL